MSGLGVGVFPSRPGTPEDKGKMEKDWQCGATGLSVEESFAYERAYLKPLPLDFPSFPLKEKRTMVRRDGTVYFDGNYFQVRGEYRDRSVVCVSIPGKRS